MTARPDRRNDHDDASGHPLLLRNGRLLDPVTGTYAEGDLLAVDGRIAETGPGVTAPAGAEVRDLRGGFVLPGLIDAHVHVTAITADLASLGTTSPFYIGAHAARIMSGMLDRGFTTVRDVAGADYGIAAAQADGAIRGPRMYFGGRALSQTGGHGDDRGPGADPLPAWSGSRIADGIDAVRAAARDELRKGGHHIKVMASGGVASPTDRIDSVQFSMDELRAVVDEAQAANRYVCAHAYTARAVNRALEAGIRSDRAREPHRCLQRVAARRAGRLPGADPGDVLGAEEGRQAVRAAGGKLAEGGRGAGRGAVRA